TVIDEAYQKAGVNRSVKYFRFPYGDKGAPRPEFMSGDYGEALKRKEAIQEFLHSEGFTQPAFEGITYTGYRSAGWLDDVDWMWTYDCLEWSIHNLQPQHGITSLEAVFARMDEN